MPTTSELVWREEETYKEAVLGGEADGVRFTLTVHPTCYRRGRFRLLVEVLPGPHHHAWGCLDEQDQPTRWYHLPESALAEAQAIADVLYKHRVLSGPPIEEGNDV